jgi:hypothetical protein
MNKEPLRKFNNIPYTLFSSLLLSCNECNPVSCKAHVHDKSLGDALEDHQVEITKEATVTVSNPPNLIYLLRQTITKLLTLTFMVRNITATV